MTRKQGEKAVGLTDHIHLDESQKNNSQKDVVDLRLKDDTPVQQNYLSIPKPSGTGDSLWLTKVLERLLVLQFRVCGLYRQ